MIRMFGVLTLALFIQAANSAARPEVCGDTPRAVRQTFEDLAKELPAQDYLDQVLACTGMARTDSVEAPESGWLQADARAYSALLATKKDSWLVLPAQVQYLGFDFAERALISAEIADAFADQVAPDTLLVARALGESRRRFPKSLVDELTNSLGTTRRLEIYVGHDGKHKISLTLQLFDCAPRRSCKLLKQRDWRDLPFSDQRPPFLAVGALKNEIRREFLGAGPLAVKGSPASRPMKDVSPAVLGAAKAETPLNATALLATLATEHSPQARERLNVVSLRAALRAPRSAESRLLAALAAMNLERRPYALALLRDAKDPASQVLRELLDGNLPQARKNLEAVTDPVQRLMLALEVQDLVQYYDARIEFPSNLVRGAFGAAGKDWLSLVEARARDEDGWVVPDPRAIKELLDILAPVPMFSGKSAIVGSVALGKGVPDDLSVIQLNFKHLDHVLTTLSASSCCVERSVQWQLHWLLEGWTQASVLQRLNLRLNRQALPQDALRILDEFSPRLSGEPNFERNRAIAMTNMAANAGNADAPRYSQRYRQASLLVLYGSLGQTESSRFTAFNSTEYAAFADAFSRDFPSRVYWPTPGGQDSGSRISECAMAEYSIVDIERPANCLGNLAPAEQAKKRVEFARRFHGHPGAALAFDRLAAAAMPEGPLDDDQQIARARAALARDPQNWRSIENLAILLLKLKGDYAQADQVFKGYRDFSPRADVGNQSVRLSNLAFDAGSHFFWMGKTELAGHYYRIAAGLRTGSDASLSSASRLAQLNGDYPAAAEILLQRADRYSSSYAYRDYLSYLHAMGFHEEARSGFEQLLEISEYPHVWLAELVGQRMTATSYAKMKAWLMSDGIRDARYRGNRFAPYFAVLWATSDRVPPADFPKFMESLERDVKRVLNHNLVTRPHPKSEASVATVYPSRFRAGKAPKLPDGTNVPSEYVLLSRALSALGARQYPQALQAFDSLADRYSIDDADGMNYVLPYYARAAAKTGDMTHFEDFVKSLDGFNNDFDALLSLATFAAVRRDVPVAERLLSRAFRFRPHTEGRPIMTEYQYAEACEFVAGETGDARFIAMLLDWARRHQRLHPTHGWAYAVEAQYSKVPVEANRALALAIYLDPSSPRIAAIDAKRRADASDWLRKNNPFVPPADVKHPDRVTWTVP